MAGEGETIVCSNCKRDIAASNFVMHEMHCRRHIVLCDNCQEPIPRAELDQHFNDLHAMIPCVRCQVQVSREDMEKHMDSECNKKPVMCEYCELSFPKCEMASHSDYCGSRTESCSSCQQYVMLKDMLRHENSGCTYPEPKLTSPPSNLDHDPFRMDELFQDMFDTPFEFTPGSLARELTRNTDTRNRILGVQNSSTSMSTSSRTNRGGQTGQKKSDVNIQRAQNLSPETDGGETWQSTIPPDMDYDTMLALQLTHEEWQLPVESQQLDQLSNQDRSRFDLGDFVTNTNVLESSDTPSNTRAHDPQSGTDVYQHEDMTIPCELCDMEIPLATYLEHVESCPLGWAGSMHSDRNNELTSSHQLTPRANIPVINNLGTSLSVSSPSTSLLTRANLPQEELVLPCEFCEDIFSVDIISQHQSVCQANNQATPTSSTREDHNSVTHTPFKSPLARSRPCRHQPNQPLTDFMDRNYDEKDNVNEGGLNTIRFHSVPESSSNKSTPAINRLDGTVIHSQGQSACQNCNEDEADLTNHRLNGTEGRRPNKDSHSAPRARLNQLSQEVAVSGASRTNPSAARKKKKTRLADKNRSGSSERNCNADSRSVMSQLDRAKQTPGRCRYDENSKDEVPITQSRQRSNQMFSPELRLKPDHNPPQPKKK